MRKIILGLFLAASLIAFGARAYAATFWFVGTGGSSGSTGSWTTLSNWLWSGGPGQPTRLPGAGDTVYIGNSTYTNMTVTIPKAGTGITSETVGNLYVESGSTISPPTGTTYSAYLYVRGNFTISGSGSSISPDFTLTMQGNTSTTSTITMGSSVSPLTCGLAIDSTVAGNLPIALASNVTMGAGTTFRVLAGTFDLSYSGTGYELTITNPLNFTSPATIAIGSGTLNAGSNAVSVGASGSTITATSGSVIAKGFSVTAGTFSFGTSGTGSITASGNVTINGGTFNAGNSTLKMGGPGTTATTSLTMGAGYSLYNLTMNTGANVLLASALTLNGNLAVDTGSRFNLTGYAFSVGGTITILGTGYTFPSSTAAPPSGQGVLDLEGTENITMSAGALNTTSGTVRYYGTTAGGGPIALPLGNSYYNLVFDQQTGGTSWSPSGNVTVNGDLNVHDGTFSLGSNNLSVTGTTYIDGGSGYGGNLTLGTGTTTLSGALTFRNNYGGTGNGLTGGAPALTGGSGALTIAGNVTGAGLFTASSGSTTFKGNLELFDSSIAAGSGNIGTFTANGGTAYFASSGNTLSEYVDGGSFSSLNVGTGTTLDVVVPSGAGGTNTLTVTGTLTTAGTASVLDAGNQNFSINTLANAGTFQLDGLQSTQSITTPDTTAGIVRYYASSGQTTGTVGLSSFYNLTIDGTGVTYSLASATTVSGKLSVSAGTLKAGANAVTVDGGVSIASGAVLNGGSATIDVYGSWANSAGNAGFVYGTSNVVFRGAATATISGNTTFYTFTSTHAGKTIQFTAGSTQTISSSFTITGAAGNPLNLLSTTTGTQWTICAASSTVKWAWIEDSGVISPSNGFTGANITATDSHDAGDNTIAAGATVGWVFPTTNVAWTGSTSSDWNVSTNWNPEFVPNYGDNVTVNSGTPYQPVLSALVSIGTLTQGSGASINLNGYPLTVNSTASLGGTISNGSTTSAAFTVSGGTTLTAGVTIGGSGNPLPTTLTGAVGGAYSLSINSGAGKISFGSTVSIGNTTTATSLSLSSTATSPQISTGSSITLANGLTLTAGELSMGSNALKVAGNISRTSGTINSTGTVTLDGTGAQSVDFTGSTLTNLTVNNTYGTSPQVTSSAAITLGGALTLTAGELSMGSNALKVAGNISRTSGTINSTGTVTLDGTGAQSVDFTGSTLTNLTVNNTSGTTPQVTATGSATLGGTLTLTAGTLAMAGNALKVAGNITLGTGGSGSITSTGTVTLDGTGAAQSVDFTGSTLANLTVNNTYGTAPQVTSSVAITLGGGLTLTAGELSMAGNALTVAGNISRTNGTINSTGTVTLDGTGAQSVDFTSSTLTNLTVNNTYGTSPQVTSSAAIALGGGLTLTAGELSMGSNALKVAGNISRTSGTINSTGTVTLDGTGAAQSVDFTGSTLTNLTVNNTSGTSPQVAASGSATLGGTLTLTAGRLAMAGNALKVAGNIALSGGSGSLTSTGTVTLDGSTQQTANFTGSSLANLTVNNTSGTAPQVTLNNTAGFTWSGNLTLTAGTLALANYTQTIGGNVSGAGTLDASAITGGNTLTVSGYMGTSGTTLGALSAPTSSTVYVGGNWDVGSLTANGGTVNFSSGSTQNIYAEGGSFSGLSKSGGSTLVLMAGPLDVTGTLTTASAGDTVNLQGYNFTVSKLSNSGTILLTGSQATQSIATMDTAKGTVIYDGTSGGSVLLPTFYDLTINGSGTFSLGQAISVADTFTITSGTLDVTPNNYGITVGVSWTNAVGTSGFNAENGTVTLDGGVNPALGTPYTYTVSGNNAFYQFVCSAVQDSKNAGATINFAGGDTQTILPGGYLNVQGTSGAYITMTSTTAASSQHWTFDLSVGAVFNILKYATVQWSIASPNSIAVPPYVIAGPAQNDKGWLSTIPVVASWTVDPDQDGKIDAIVVEVASPVDDNFSGLSVSVSGYTVTGFTTNVPSPYNGSTQADDAYFTINLKPGPNLDTSATPTWTINKNTTLVDNATKDAYVGPNGVTYTPNDLAPPIIGYTLAIAGRNQIFVDFSEPVVEQGGGAIKPSDFTLSNGDTVSSLKAVKTQGGGTLEALLTLNQTITAANVLSPATITAGTSGSPLRDLASPSATTPPSGYTNGPNNLAVTPHRISDLGLGMPGNGVVEPLWAKNNALTVSSSRGGVGIIHGFDGSDWLEAKAMTLQALINPKATATASSPGVDLVFDSNVPSSVKVGSLWLPPHITSRLQNQYSYNGLIVSPNSATDSSTGSDPTSNPRLRSFGIPSGNAKLSSGATVEFLLEVTNVGGLPLYCARVTNPNASNWYDDIAPWSFQLHNIIAQRSAVTILNNVIDPLKGDKADLTYTVSSTGTVTINVFDLSGGLVDTLYRGIKSAGQYSTSWDGRNFNGQAVARGVYFIRVVAPGVDQYRKVLVVK